MHSRANSTRILTMPGKQNVVIVGGGVAGIGLARQLSSKLSPEKHTLTLISACPYYTHRMASIRMVVSPTDDLQGLIPYDRLFKPGSVGTYKVGIVIDVKKNADGQSGKVVLQSGEEYAWDVVIYATGSTWEGPMNFPVGPMTSSVGWIDMWREQFRVAKHVVIVGGGAIGAEMAGEIKDSYPETEVTIVHRGRYLLNDIYPDKFREALGKNFESRGVRLILNDTIGGRLRDGGPVKGVKTAAGRWVPADLLIPARGPCPNTGFLESLRPNVLDERGQVRVEMTLQLRSESHMFALGDIIDLIEQKQHAKADAHVPVVVSNVLSVLNGLKPKSVYKGSPEFIVVSNGRNMGMTYVPFLGGVKLGNWMTSAAKSKTLMVPQLRSQLRY